MRERGDVRVKCGGVEGTMEGLVSYGNDSGFYSE